MIKKRDLPLTALRTFTAAASTQSFTKAALALGVTQSAVSRHIATLESLLKSNLFTRRGPQVALTPCGQQLYDDIGDAMATIERAVHRLLEQHYSTSRLRVRTSMPSFSMKLIVPGLHEYTNSTGIAIDLITSLAAPMPQDAFDVLISRDQILAETDSWELAREELICVGSANLITAIEDTPHPRGWPTITARSRPDIMSLWLSSYEAGMPKHHIVATYDHLFFAMAAATGGTGLLVAPRLLVADQLRDGTLTQVGTASVASGARYTSYINPASPNIQAATQFCRWLKRRLQEMDEERR